MATIRLLAIVVLVVCVAIAVPAAGGVEETESLTRDAFDVPPAAASTVTMDGGGHASAVGSASASDEDNASSDEGNASSDERNATNETLGYVDGYWYDDSLDVDQADGPTEDELAAVVARAMARIEVLRERSFEANVTVDVVTREEAAEEIGAERANLSDAERLAQNVRYEALFLVGRDADATDVLGADRVEEAAGFYDPIEDRIVLIADAEGTLVLDEPTLVHELVHALQDQRVDLSTFEGASGDRATAIAGLIEGEATYLEHRYDERCSAEWDCVLLDGDVGDDEDTPANWGVTLLEYQPYSDGPTFVETLLEAGGWEAVDEAYADPPVASAQIVDPDRYGETPTTVSVTDLSDERWDPFVLEPGRNHTTVGQAALAAMFVHPTFTTDGAVEIVPREAFVNTDTDGESDAFDPFEYSLRYSDGWEGDALVTYVTNGSNGGWNASNASTAAGNATATAGEESAANATAVRPHGYVWTIAWADDEHADEFIDGYAALLDHYGATSVDGRSNTYRLANDSSFAGAYYVEREERFVTIVYGPAVETLSAIRAGSAPREKFSPASEHEFTPDSYVHPYYPYQIDDAFERHDPTATEAPETDGIPGFGASVALLVIVTTVLCYRRRVERR